MRKLKNVRCSLISKDCMICGGKRVFTSNRLRRDWYNELRCFFALKFHKWSPTHRQNKTHWKGL